MSAITEEFMTLMTRATSGMLRQVGMHLNTLRLLASRGCVPPTDANLKKTKKKNQPD